MRLQSMTVSKRITVDRLARVEGEGALDLSIVDGRVQDVRLRIFEPPRFFEAILKGRRFTEAPDLTARICGICPVAYQMSAVHAMEAVAKVAMPQPIQDLRRLLYCGEWVESHALHIFMLHAPDFLGYRDAIEMAKDHAEIVRLGLAIKKAGNAIVALIGGRATHPVNVRVGGFHSWPNMRGLMDLRASTEQALDRVSAALAWARTLDFPEYQMEHVLVALQPDTEYPFCGGPIATTEGFSLTASDFLGSIEEYQSSHSTALNARRRARGRYLTGPLARFALNRSKLSSRAKASADLCGLTDGCRNPFKSLMVRLIEIEFALEEALRLVDGLQAPDAPYVDFDMAAGVGVAATEAPRGLLIHQYAIDRDGLILLARIVPPTAQNQSCIEEDIRGIAQNWMDLPDPALTRLCEIGVRNHDPCISCATHALRVRIERSAS